MTPRSAAVTSHRLTIVPIVARWLTVAAVLAGAACEAAPPPPTPPAFRSVVTNQQLMAEVLEPAANVYWEAVGTTVDKRGTVEHVPKSDAEWAAVRNAATVIAESGNLMLITPRALDRDDWTRLARALVDVGERARRAAGSHDRAAVFDAGAEVYQACVNCHVRYMPGVASPAK